MEPALPDRPDRSLGNDDRTGPAAAAPAVSSEALLGGGRELVILHGDDRYRLRLTRQGKLILTK